MVRNPNASAAPASSSLDDVMRLSQPTIPGPSRARGIFGSILGGLGNLVFPGLGTIIGGAVGGAGLGAAMPTLGGETSSYLMLQRQIQQETLAFETASTVLKVRHDCALHAIQNMK
jgi:hypothetical protein